MKCTAISLCRGVFLALSLLSGSLACAQTRPAESLERATQQVQAEFNRIDASLRRAAHELGRVGLTGDPARAALLRLCTSVPYAVDCAAVSREGRMVTVEPAAFRSFEGKDISDQEQVKRVMKTGKPAMSALFQSVEGIPAIDVEYPVFSPDQRQIGAVSVLLYPERLLGGVIKPLLAKQATDPKKDAGAASLNLWAMDLNGSILYDVDTREIGLNLFTSEAYRGYTSLIRLGQRMIKADAGSGTYQFLRDDSEKKIVKKEATWQTVSLFGTPWRIVAVKSF